MALSLVLAESSIELVPNELVHHPSILNSARRKGRNARELILDQSYHHAAILLLGPSGARRGRPDIAHMSLLAALGSPLSLEGGLQSYVHTRNEMIITIDPKTRLPKNTDRFTSLLEQLYRQKKLPLSGRPLLTLKSGSVTNLLGEVSGDIVIALTTEGTLTTMSTVAAKLADHDKPVLLVGGFPRGHFSREVKSATNESYRIGRHSLEASTVVARAIYDYEKALNQISRGRGSYPREFQK